MSDNINPSIFLVLFDQISQNPKEIWHPFALETIMEIIEAAQLVVEKMDQLVEFKAPFVVLSDIHGNYQQFHRIFCKNRVDFKKEAYVKNTFVILGDYVDRGEESIRCLIFLCLHIILFPDQTVPLRGNHEIDCINFKYGFKKECVKWFGNQKGMRLFKRFNKFFEHLPLAGLADKKVLLLHGGVSSKLTELKDIRDLAKPLVIGKGTLGEDLVWADHNEGLEVSSEKREPEAQESPNERRFCSVTVNGKFIEDLCHKLKIDLIIRGHLYCPDGVDFYANNKFMTIFSVPNYDNKKNKGAVLVVSKDYQYRIDLYQDEETRGAKPDAFDELTTRASNEEKRQKKQKTFELYQKCLKDNPKKPKASKEGSKNTKPSKQSKDNKNPKKSENPKQKEKSKASISSPSISTGKVALGVTLVLSLLIGSVVAAPSDSTPLSKFSSHSNILARYVNGIALGQSVLSGSLNKNELIKELFYLGPDVTLDDLSSSKVTELDADLSSIQKLIDTECNGPSGCEVPKAVFDGMGIVKGMEVHVDAIQKALDQSGTGALDDFNKMNDIIAQINAIKVPEFLSSLTEGLKKLDSDSIPAEDKATELFKIYLHLKNLEELRQNLKLKPTLISGLATDSLSTIKDELTSIEPVKAISTSLSGQQTSIETLLNDLTSQVSVLNKLASSIQSSKIQDISLKTDLMMKLSPSSQHERVLTAGFPHGLDDLKNSLSDDQNVWLKKFLNGGGNLTSLTSQLAPLKKLSSQLDPLHSRFKKATLNLGFQHWKLIPSLTESSQTISQLSNLLSSYKTCIKPIKLGYKFTDDVSGLLSNLEVPAPVSSQLTSLNSFFTTNADSLDTFEELYKVATKYQGKFDKSVAVLQNSTLVNNTLESLSTFVPAIKSLDLGALVDWLKEIKVGPLSKNLKDWNQNSEFMAAMNCLKDEDYAGKIQQLNPSTQSLSGLKQGNQDVESTKKLAKSLGEISAEWIKLKPSLKSKSKRAAQFQLKNAQQVSKNLGDISFVSQKLDGMLKQKTDLDVLVKGKQTIDTAIQGISNSNEKSRLEKMWSDEGVKALEKNLKTAQAVSDAVANNQEFGNMTDFKAPYEKASEVEECQIDIKRMASSLSGRITDQKVANSLESLKSLDLTFSKQSKASVGGVVSNLQSFFDDVFNMNAKRLRSASCDDASGECTSSTEKPSESNNLVTILIVLAVVFLVCVGVCIILGIIYREKIKEKWRNRNFGRKKPVVPSKKKKGEGEEDEVGIEETKEGKNAKKEKKLELNDIEGVKYARLVNPHTTDAEKSIKEAERTKEETTDNTKKDLEKDMRPENRMIFRLLRLALGEPIALDFVKKLDRFWDNHNDHIKITHFIHRFIMADGFPPELYFNTQVEPEGPPVVNVDGKPSDLSTNLPYKCTMHYVGKNDDVWKWKRKNGNEMVEIAVDNSSKSKTETTVEKTQDSEKIERKEKTFEENPKTALDLSNRSSTGTDSVIDSEVDSSDEEFSEEEMNPKTALDLSNRSSTGTDSVIDSEVDSLDNYEELCEEEMNPKTALDLSNRSSTGTDCEIASEVDSLDNYEELCEEEMELMDTDLTPEPDSVDALWERLENGMGIAQDFYRIRKQGKDRYGSRIFGNWFGFLLPESYGAHQDPYKKMQLELLRRRRDLLIKILKNTKGYAVDFVTVCYEETMKSLSGKKLEKPIEGASDLSGTSYTEPSQLLSIV